MQLFIEEDDLDATDIKILKQLQQDADLTNNALAASVGTSPATCLRRVKRLQDAGIVQRRIALLDGARLGAGLTAVAEVSLDRQGVEHLHAFEGRATLHPAVRQCYRVSPGPDFILVLTVRDMRAWSELIEMLFTQDANVRNVKTYFVVGQSKFEPTPDLTSLEVQAAKKNQATRLRA